MARTKQTARIWDREKASPSGNTSSIPSSEATSREPQTHKAQATAPSMTELDEGDDTEEPETPQTTQPTQVQRTTPVIGEGNESELDEGDEPEDPFHVGIDEIEMQSELDDEDLTDTEVEKTGQSDIQEERSELEAVEDGDGSMGEDREAFKEGEANDFTDFEDITTDDDEEEGQAQAVSIRATVDERIRTLHMHQHRSTAQRADQPVGWWHDTTAYGTVYTPVGLATETTGPRTYLTPNQITKTESVFRLTAREVMWIFRKTPWQYWPIQPHAVVSYRPPATPITVASVQHVRWYVDPKTQRVQMMELRLPTVEESSPRVFLWRTRGRQVHMYLTETNSVAFGVMFYFPVVSSIRLQIVAASQRASAAWAIAQFLCSGNLTRGPAGAFADLADLAHLAESLVDGLRQDIRQKNISEDRKTYLEELMAQLFERPTGVPDPQMQTLRLALRNKPPARPTAPYDLDTLLNRVMSADATLEDRATERRRMREQIHQWERQSGATQAPSIYAANFDYVHDPAAAAEHFYAINTTYLLQYWQEKGVPLTQVNRPGILAQIKATLQARWLQKTQVHLAPPDDPDGDAMERYEEMKLGALAYVQFYQLLYHLSTMQNLDVYEYLQNGFVHWYKMMRPNLI